MATYQCPKCKYTFGNKFKYLKRNKVEGSIVCPNCHREFYVGVKQKNLKLSEWHLKSLEEWSKETGLPQKAIAELAITKLVKSWDKRRQENIDADSSARDKTVEGRRKRLAGIPHSDEANSRLITLGKGQAGELELD